MSSRSLWVRLVRALRGLVRSPQAVVVAGFAAVILAGAALLRLPWLHAPGRVNFIDALFTATSAVCVTGLIVVDTEKDFTRLGQIAIMLLVQIGGIGVMTYAALVFGLAGRRMPLRFQAALQDSFYQRDVARQFRSSFRRIVRATLLIELGGAALLFLFLLPREPARQAVFSAVFHAIAAFCNAGFSIYSENLVRLRDNPAFLVTIMLLVVGGGLGFTVVDELWLLARGLVRRGHERRPELSLHARLVLRTTAFLLAAGFLGLLVFGLTPGEATWPEKVLGAMFQSVTPRTAGFNTVDIGALPHASIFLLILLMFIGGSPGSCAGGVKTSSVAVWLATIRARLRGREDVVLLQRRLAPGLVERVLLLLGLAGAFNLVGILILCWTERAGDFGGLHHVTFEQISAFGTVGLSLGLTPHLSTAGKLWIILTMFVGRLGPLTLAAWLVQPARAHVRHPEGKVMIG